MAWHEAVAAAVYSSRSSIAPLCFWIFRLLDGNQMCGYSLSSTLSPSSRHDDGLYRKFCSTWQECLLAVRYSYTVARIVLGLGYLSSTVQLCSVAT